MTKPRSQDHDRAGSRPPLTPGADRELAGRLEAWLDRTAQPAPSDLASDVLQYLPEQAGRSRLPWLRWRATWTNQRWASRSAMGITVAAALAVLAVAVLRPDLRPAALPSASSFSRSWDPAADFRVGQAATNPAPDGYGHPAVWSYRFARPGVPTPGDYPLLTAFDFSAQAWVTPGAGSAVSLADGRLVLRPAGAVEGPAVIVSWASPVSAQIAIRGSFAVTSSGCDGDVALSIERGAVSHWLATIKPGSTAPFDITTSVVPGVPINFVVRGLGDRVCEAAALNARILELAGP